MYTHIDMVLLTFVSHAISLLSLVRRVAHYCKKAMRNYQIQAYPWLDITAPSIRVNPRV